MKLNKIISFLLLICLLFVCKSCNDEVLHASSVLDDSNNTYSDVDTVQGIYTTTNGYEGHVVRVNKGFLLISKNGSCEVVGFLDSRFKLLTFNDYVFAYKRQEWINNRNYYYGQFLNTDCGLDYEWKSNIKN